MGARLGALFLLDGFARRERIFLQRLGMLQARSIERLDTFDEPLDALLGLNSFRIRQRVLLLRFGVLQTGRIETLNALDHATLGLLALHVGGGWQTVLLLRVRLGQRLRAERLELRLEVGLDAWVGGGVAFLSGSFHFRWW